MTNRRFGDKDSEQFPVTELIAPVNADEAFVNALAAGDQSLRGTDPLADLFLDFKSELDRDMPAPPTLAMLGLEDVSVDAPEPLADCAPADSHPATDQFPANVVPLRGRGKRLSKHSGEKRGFRSNFVSGLVGAAAATLVIAGGGSMVAGAGVDSPLYGLNQRLFGGTSETAVVELASALEQVDKLSNAGDAEGARQALEQARAIVDGMKPKDRPPAQTQVDRVEASLVKTTETVTVTETAPAEPTTVTVVQSPGTTPTPVAEPTTTAVAPVAPVAPVQQPTSPAQASPAPSVSQPNQDPDATAAPAVPLEPPVVFN